MGKREVKALEGLLYGEGFSTKPAKRKAQAEKIVKKLGQKQTDEFLDKYNGVDLL